MRSAQEVTDEIGATRQRLEELERELSDVTTVAFVVIVDVRNRRYTVMRFSSAIPTTEGIYVLRWLPDKQQGHVHYDLEVGAFNVTLRFGETFRSIYEDPHDLLFHLGGTLHEVIAWGQEKIAA